MLPPQVIFLSLLLLSLQIMLMPAEAEMEDDDPASDSPPWALNWLLEILWIVCDKKQNLHVMG